MLSNRKKKVCLFTILLWIVANVQALAQDVEGVAVGVYMAEEQIFAKFGEPDKVDSKTDDVGTVTKMYYYAANEVFFTDGFMTEFLIKDNHFKVLKTKISGGVTVGDLFAKVSPLKPEFAAWLKDSEIYYVTIETV